MNPIGILRLSYKNPIDSRNSIIKILYEPERNPIEILMTSYINPTENPVEIMQKTYMQILNTNLQTSSKTTYVNPKEVF